MTTNKSFMDTVTPPLRGSQNSFTVLVGGQTTLIKNQNKLERKSERLYSKETLYKSQYLRNNTNNCENYLWIFLKNRQLNNFKFRRQQPIDKYIVDFINFETNLIIEVDGQQHCNKPSIEHDEKRDNLLKSIGYRILRFWASDVFNNIDNVLETIYANLTPHQSSKATLTPPQGGSNGIHLTKERK